MEQRKGIDWNTLENGTTKTDGNPETPKAKKWNQVFTERQDNTAVKSVAPVSEPDWNDENTKNMVESNGWEVGSSNDVRTDESYKKGQNWWNADRDRIEYRKKPGNTSKDWFESGDKRVVTAKKRDGKWSKVSPKWRSLE